MSQPQQDRGGSRLADVATLGVGCAPILLDQMLPPWGIPAAIITIWLILKRRGQSWNVLGLVRPAKGWANTLLVGIGGAALVLALDQYLFPTLQSLMGLSGQDLSSYEGIEGNNSLLVVYLTVAWTTAGLGEELIFRGFLMSGLARCLGGSRTAWVGAILLSSLFFGLIHLQTGMGAVLSTGITGAVFAGLFLLSRQCIWPAYLAHGLVNTVGFLLIYTGMYKDLM